MFWQGVRIARPMSHSAHSWILNKVLLRCCLPSFLSFPQFLISFSFSPLFFSSFLPLFIFLSISFLSTFFFPNCMCITGNEPFFLPQKIFIRRKVGSSPPSSFFCLLHHKPLQFFKYITQIYREYLNRLVMYLYTFMFKYCLCMKAHTIYVVWQLLFFVSQYTLGF